jgi:predicted membrane protein
MISIVYRTNQLLWRLNSMYISHVHCALRCMCTFVRTSERDGWRRTKSIFSFSFFFLLLLLTSKFNHHTIDFAFIFMNYSIHHSRNTNIRSRRKKRKTTEKNPIGAKFDREKEPIRCCHFYFEKNRFTCSLTVK